MTTTALLGPRSIIYHSTDIARDKANWTKLLGIEPYFDEPFYVGYTVGGYELGLEAVETSDRAGLAMTYWGVQDITTAVQELKGRGAKVTADINEVGDGIKMAILQTADGQQFGVIENPQFKLP